MLSTSFITLAVFTVFTQAFANRLVLQACSHEADCGTMGFCHVFSPATGYCKLKSGGDGATRSVSSATSALTDRRSGFDSQYWPRRDIASEPIDVFLSRQKMRTFLSDEAIENVKDLLTEEGYTVHMLSSGERARRTTGRRRRPVCHIPRSYLSPFNVPPLTLNYYCY